MRAWARKFPKACFVEPDQPDLACPVLFAEINLFSITPNQIHKRRRLVPLEGRIAIVTNAGRDAVDAAASARWKSRGELRLVSDWMARGRTMLAADGEVVWS